jgi:hypothetical protein
VAGAQARAAVADQVVRAIEEELAGQPRADGTPARIKDDTNRIHLARQILDGLDRKP